LIPEGTIPLNTRCFCIIFFSGGRKVFHEKIIVETAIQEIVNQVKELNALKLESSPSDQRQ